MIERHVNKLFCLSFLRYLVFIWNAQLSYTWTWKHFIGNGYEPKKYLSLKNRQGARDLWIEDEFLRWKWQHWQSEGIFTRSKKNLVKNVISEDKFSDKCQQYVSLVTINAHKYIALPHQALYLIKM